MSFFAPKSELALAFDIGSSSVSAALLWLSHGAAPRMLHSVHRSLPYQENSDPDRLFNDMIEALKKCHEDIAKEGASRLSGTPFRHVDARRAYYSFASPWSATQTKTISLRPKAPFAFTRELLNSVMLDEDERFKKQAIGDRKVFPEALTVIERRIIQTKLNGYDIIDPFGKRAMEADISYFSGIVPKSVLDRVMEISHSAHVSKRAKTFTFPLAAYSSIRDANPKETDFIHLRIGGEISDVAVVRDSAISSSGSFPEGVRQIVRAVSRESGMGREETLSAIRISVEGESLVIEKVAKEWTGRLVAAFDKLGVPIPRKLFLTAEDDMSAFFAGVLEREGGFQVALAGEPLDLVSSFAARTFESEKN